MKVFNSLLLAIVFPFIVHAQWQQKSDFPGTARDDGTSFVIGSNAYCVTGLEVGWACTRNGAVFNASSETWTTMNDLPLNEDRQYSCSFSHGGFGFVFGGLDCSGNYLKDLWRFDPVNDSWLAMLSIPDSGRSGSGSFVIGDTAYIVGGKNNVSQGLAEVWAYSILANTWTKKNNLPMPGCWRGSAFAIDTIGYLCFGSHGNGTFNHNMFSYQHAQDLWTVVPGVTLPARTYVGSAVVYEKACMFGGQDSSGTFANVLLEYNSVTQNISTHPGIPDFPRRGGMAFSLNNMFYYTTGLDSTSTRQKQTWRSSHITEVPSTNFSSGVINIFPLPFTEKFTIRSDKKIVSVQLFNLLGKDMLTVASENVFEIDIPGEQLIEGQYILKIELSDESIGFKKIIKANSP